MREVEKSCNYHPWSCCIF